MLSSSQVINKNSSKTDGVIFAGKKRSISLVSFGPMINYPFTTVILFGLELIT